MNRFLLDTNTWVTYFRATNLSVASKIKSYQANEVYLCSIVLFELCYGLQRSAVAYRAAQSVQLLRIRTLHRSIPFDDKAAEVAGDLRQHLAKLGTPIGPSDLLIAATALAHSLIVVTSNTKEFSRVPNLVYEDWC